MHHCANLRSLAKKMWGGVLLCLCVILLASCENFLKGRQTADELQQIIEYNNAPGCTILLKSDSSTGTFLSGDSKEFKIGYEEEIYFSVNKETCIFQGLTVQSITDYKADMSGYVEFKITERDEEKGLYKISVKVLKAAPDLVIRPVCIPYPAVESYYPPENSGASYANMPIVITFTTQMEYSYIIPAQSEFNYKNIFLTYGSDDVSQYFNTPYFNDAKTILTLNPKDDFLEYLKSKQEIVISVTVDFSDNIIVKNGFQSIPFKKNENSQFVVNYKPEVEAQPPVESGYGFFASTQYYSLEDINSMNKDQLEKIFEEGDLSVRKNMTSSEYKRKILNNRTTGTVYIYGRYYDKDSGVNKISLSQNHTNDKTGYPLNLTSDQKDYLVGKQYSDIEFFSDQNNVSFCIKYELLNDLTKDDNNDGAFVFDITVYDACNNASEQKTVTAIKDTSININEAQLYTFTPVSATQGLDAALTNINNGKYNEKIKQANLEYVNTVYSNITINDTSTFFIKYTDINGNSVKQEFENDIRTSSIYHSTLDVDHVHDLEVTLVAQDLLGKETERVFKYPPQPNKVVQTPPQNQTVNDYYLLQEDCAWTNIFVLKATTETGTKSKHNTNYYYLTKQNEGPDVIFAMDSYNWFVCENNFLFSEISETYLSGTAPDDFYTHNFIKDNSLAKPGLENVEYTLIPGDTNYSVKVKLSDDVWGPDNNKYDYVIIYYKDTFSDNYKRLMLMEPGVTEKAISIYGFLSLNYSYKFYAAGLKDSKLSDYSAEKSLSLTYNEQIQYKEELSKKHPPVAEIIYLAGVADESEYSTELGYSKAADYMFVRNISSDSAFSQLKSIRVIVNNSFVRTYNEESIQKLTVSVQNHKRIYIPISDFVYGDNDVTVVLENDYGTASYTATGRMYTLNLEQPKIVFDAPKISQAQNSITLDSKLTESPIETGSTNYISSAYLTNLGWEENKKYTYSQVLEEIDGKNFYKYRITENSLPQNTYVKIVASLKNGHNISKMIFYNGTPSTGSLTDKLIEMGDSFMVTSDQPVYIFTVATNSQKEVCSRWTIEEWETLHLIYNEHLLNFSANSGNFRIYGTDTSVLNDGECYVVIAQFADGHKLMSRVMEK